MGVDDVFFIADLRSGRLPMDQNSDAWVMLDVMFTQKHHETLQELGDQTTPWPQGHQKYFEIQIHPDSFFEYHYLV